MKNSALNWDNLGWGNFEAMTVYLAQEVFGEPYFERYLKQGNKQHGVDIITYRRKTGKHISIQCKDTTSNVNALREISEKFIEGQFFSTSDIFILATTGDLQNKNAQDYIRTQKEYFNDFSIEYLIWDINKIDTLLKNHYRAVCHYFSQAEAKKHCLPQSPVSTSFIPITNFISRLVSNIEESQQVKDYWLHENEQKKTYSLTDIITEKPLETKSICLLADPYEGKTILLENTINDLLKSEQRYFPLLLRIKSLPILPIEDLLTGLFHTWEAIPAKDIVVFIDGLDEVPTDKFVDMLSHVHMFRAKYPYISFVFSCRKLFFHHYKVNKNLDGFSYFQLESLSYYNLHTYLDVHLKDNKEKFLKKMIQTDLLEFLRNPFYLINLVKWYKKDPKSIPNGKIEIINKFIEESLEISETRKLSRGIALDHKRVQHKKTIIKLALALQISGLNATPKDFIQEIFDTEEIELLQNSAVISNDGEYWSFHNAMFQEQLAAMKLRDYSFEKINSLVTIGKTLRKIRTKWIQTVASYLSVVSDSDPVKTEMIALVNNDNPEILTIADGSKFKPDFRLKVIKNIFARSIKKHIRLLLVSESVVSAFIADDKNIISYLVEILSSDATERVKVVCCRILRESKLNTEACTRLETAIQKQLMTASLPYFAQLLFELLAKNKLSNRSFIDKFISQSEIIREHECREGLYMLIGALDLVDKYYQFALDGFQILFDYNTDISHHASERELEALLLKTKSPENLIKLYEKISQKGWLKFYRNKASATKEFITQLTSVSTHLYEKDKKIMFSVINFLIAGEKRFINSEINGIIRFFHNTNNSGLALELYLLKSQGKYYHHDFSALLQPKDFDRIIRLAEDGHATRGDLYSFYVGLFQEGRKAEAKEFLNMIDLVFAKQKDGKNSYHQIYLEAKATRKKNDYLFIQSEEHFRTAITNFFAYFKRGTISSEKLYKEPERRVKRTHLESNYLLSFVQNRKEDNKSVSLKACIATLDQERFFELWRAKKILGTTLSNTEEDRKLKSILEDLYNKEIQSADFTNFHIPNKTTGYLNTENLIIKIWKEYGFATPNQIVLQYTWMITEGLKGIESAKLNKNKSLAETILKHFEGKEELLEEKILQNFLTGIKSETVITSHLDLCEKLKISETPSIILNLIENKQLSFNSIYYALEIYKNLNGDLELLLPYFHSLQLFENYNFERLVKYLILDFPDEISPRLIKTLTSERVSEEEKMTAAKYLAQIGEKIGFSYIILTMGKTKKIPFETQSDFEIWHIDTSWALAQIEKVFYLYLDEQYHDSKFYRSPDRFILELLKGIAKKSEEDLILVNDFMLEKSKKYTNKYPQTAIDLIWYAEIMIEDFRAGDEGQLGLMEIKTFLN